MANQNWVSLLQPPQHLWSGAGTSYSGTAPATISPRPTPNTPDYNVFVPAGGFLQGTLIRCTARGFLTTTATSTTLTFSLASNIGNTATTYVTLATFGGITTGTTVLVGIQWKIEALIRCTSVATSGTLATQGEMTLGNSGATITANPVALTATPGMMLVAPTVSGETAATVDTTQTQGIALRASMVAANCTVQQTQWLVEQMN